MGVVRIEDAFRFFDLFAWKNSQLACWRWSSMHAAHDDQKEKPFIAKMLCIDFNTTTYILPAYEDAMPLPKRRPGKFV